MVICVNQQCPLTEKQNGIDKVPNFVEMSYEDRKRSHEPRQAVSRKEKIRE
jgi:hypothetical protein